jgi:hypothetical protein
MPLLQRGPGNTGTLRQFIFRPPLLLAAQFDLLPHEGSGFCCVSGVDSLSFHLEYR